MRKILSIFALLLTAQSTFAFADSCPIAELVGQKFKVTGVTCNNSGGTPCSYYTDRLKSVIILKGDEWDMNDLYWIKYSRDINNPVNSDGGFGFNSNQINREDNHCTKSTNTDGSVTYNFYHNYCPNQGCSEQFVVTGNKAYFTWGGTTRFVQFSLEKF